jgi:hypothetical protein
MRRRPKRLPDKPTRARVQAYQLWSALAFHGEVPRPMDLRPLLRGRCIALTAAIDVDGGPRSDRNIRLGLISILHLVRTSGVPPLEHGRRAGLRAMQT